MNYINPYSLLNINTTNTDDIRKAKMTLLVRIAQSTKQTVAYHDNKIDIDWALELVEETADTQLADYHLFIKGYESLCAFLEEGETLFFETKTDYSNVPMMRDKGFLQFLKPYLRAAFQKAFAIAYTQRDVATLRAMQNHRLYLMLGKKPLVLTDVKKVLDKEIANIKNAYQIVNRKESYADVMEVQLECVRFAIHTDSLNVLPVQLNHYINSIGLLCCSLAKVLFEKGDEEALDFFEFVDIANSLNTSGHAAQMIQTTYNKYHKAYYKRLGIDSPKVVLDEELVPDSVKFAMAEISNLKGEFEGRTFELMGLNPAQSRLACVVLDKKSTTQFLDYIAIKKHDKTRQQVLTKVFFILNKTKKFNRAETLMLIQKYRSVFAQEIHFVKKFDRLKNRIEQAVDDEIVDANFDEKNLVKKAVNEYTTKPKAKYAQYKEVFMDWYGEHSLEVGKIAMLLPLIPVMFVAGVLCLSGMNYLTSNVELSDYQKVNEQRRIYKYHTKDYTKEKFHLNKDLYKGNQLETGVVPFETCFGAGMVATDANNQLKFSNESPTDMVLCVYDKETNFVVRQVYVRAKESIKMDHIPSGIYTMKMYVGKDWNPERPNFCSLYGGFDTNSHYVKLRNKYLINCTNNKTSTIIYNPAVKEYNDMFLNISAGGYFNYKIRD